MTINDNKKNKGINITFEEILDDTKIHELGKYRPNDEIYTKYAKSRPELLLACLKLYDVYHCLCNAREMLLCSKKYYFGDLTDMSDISTMNIITHFLICSVLEFGICLDISWQMIWAYLLPSSLTDLQKKEIKNMEKFCTRDNLLELCKEMIFLEDNEDGETIKIKKIIQQFDNKENTRKVRELYNSLKHRVTIDFKEVKLSIPHGNACGYDVENFTNTMLDREEYTVWGLSTMLYKYYFDFIEYVNELINVIIPDDYFVKDSIDECISKKIEIKNSKNKNITDKPFVMNAISVCANLEKIREFVKNMSDLLPKEREEINAEVKKIKDIINNRLVVDEKERLKVVK